jgi:hypothetical protein
LTLFSGDPPSCCDRCSLKKPLICCDICHPDLVAAMTDDRDNEYQPIPRGSNCPKRPSHVLSLRASEFRTALYDWRTETATALFGTLDFWPADLFLHEEIVEDIVVFVDIGKLVTLQDLRKKTNWIHCNEHGEKIVDLIRQFFTSSAPLFVSTPLARRTHPRTIPTPPPSSMASARPNAPNVLSNIFNLPASSAAPSSRTRKPRAPSTCTACFQKGHGRAPFLF